ncbi:response regulator [Falsiroseomonas selenitidurans]|uniref:Response regulator transcription factor n=1 Tax=Falsiroseomonas selenitidurans TaxID=2716335 RepID=A0ABX1E1D0_9PROT|nr:response regulator transcription factor [Falsiroseomonas selenitidurans]NKC29332.1 response regulator transcription factor [Falsiroseomonas selenitidurans]
MNELSADPAFDPCSPEAPGPSARHPHVAIVEDDREIAALVAGFLQSRNLTVSCAGNARQLDRLLRSQRIDVLLLDVMLPEEDGIAICRRLRLAPETAELPILLVSALGSEVDRVKGLEIGADDYVVKPFSPPELLARIRALLRRADMTTRRASVAPCILCFDGWRLDLRRHALHMPDGTRVPLTSGEFGLLGIFARQAQRILSRDHLLTQLYGRNAGPADRSMDILVSRLRRKIEPDPRDPTLIRTVRHGGYVFTPEVTALAEG